MVVKIIMVPDTLDVILEWYHIYFYTSTSIVILAPEMFTVPPHYKAL